MTNNNMTTENFARGPMIFAISCLIDVHGSNGRLSTGAIDFVNNDTTFTSEFIGDSSVSDLIGCDLVKEDGNVFVECRDTFSKKDVTIRLIDLSLFNLENVMKAIV